MQDRPECLPYCLCYMKKAAFCLDKVTYNEKKDLLRLFLKLQEQGLVNSYLTVEDVLKCFFCHERKMFTDWFPELKESCDDKTWLTWQVNTHLKMQDIEQEARRELQDCEQRIPSAPPSDQESVIDIRKTPDDLKMPLVKRILNDLELEMKYYQCSHLHTRLEVVADVVTRLFFIMKTDSNGTPYNGPSVKLTELAMDVVCAVLGNLSSLLPVSSIQAQYSSPAAVRMTHSIHHKLVKAMYTSDDMKMFLSTGNETVKAAIIQLVSAKVVRLFQRSLQKPSAPPSFLRLFLVASDKKSSPTAAQRLVIHKETVTSVLALVLMQIYSEEGKEFTFEAHKWPLVEHVVNRLSLSGVKVTKKKGKVTCYFNMNEVVCMVDSICKDLLTMYCNIKSLMEALSHKNRMVSRDIGRLVSVQLEMVCRYRKKDTPPVELPPCIDVKHVICDVVARFVHALIPVTMADKEDLILCLQLVDQICFLTEVTLFQAQETHSLARHLKELSSDTLEQLGDMVHNQYIESFPLFDVQDQIHTLVMDKHHICVISTMIITTLQDYAAWLSQGFALPDASNAVKPPPGYTVPQASPVVKPPGFAQPNACLAVRPPPEFNQSEILPAMRPPPGLALHDPSHVVKPPPGFSIHGASPAMRPPPGFILPKTTPAVQLPPGFALPDVSVTVKPPAACASPVVKPPPGFAVPIVTPYVWQLPGFTFPDISPVVMPPPGFRLHDASSTVQPPPGFTLPHISPVVKPPPGFCPHVASPVVKPPPGFAVPIVTPSVQSPSGVGLPDASLIVKPPPRFAVPVSSSEARPPPGFALPNASATAKPPPGFTLIEASLPVRPPSGFLLPDAAPAALPPSGLLLSESSRPGLCPEIPNWKMEDEAKNIEKDDQCAQDTTLTVTSNDTKDDQNQVALPSESAKPTKKKGLKGFLQKILRAFRFCAPSRDKEGRKISRNH